MVDIPMKSAVPLDRRTVFSDSQIRIRGAVTAQTIRSINAGSEPATRHAPGNTDTTRHAPGNTDTTRHTPGNTDTARHAPGNTDTTRHAPGNTDTASTASATSARQTVIADRPVPALAHPIRKGQKVPLETAGKLTRLKVCPGWNVKNPNCDVDVSAFLLNENGNVPGDDWFVFYGQRQSPDGSTVFGTAAAPEREMISVDLTKLHPMVKKIVFTLTIHEALKQRLNFSMLKDAYIRILDENHTELVSFLLTEYYENAVSMMLGELYLHNGAWKFHAIGNGISGDLAGLCEFYGVRVV